MSSFSRKYQYIIIIAFLAGLALTVSSSNLKDTPPTSFLRRAILDIYAPPLRAMSFLFAGARHLWDDYIFLVHLRQENEQLRTSLDLLTERNVQMNELLLENERLREMLLLKENSPAHIISAEVIGRDALGWFKTILINKGKNDNLYRNQAVVTHQGIVGRCIEVADTTSRVMMITDINSSVDALIQRSRSRGIVEGTGSTMCELKYIAGTDDVEVGDLVVTAGLCGIFPKGLSIGTVKHVEKKPHDLFQSVMLEPSSSLNKLEEVSLLFPAGE